MTETTPRFEAAYVAFRYLLGHRGVSLRAGLNEPLPSTGRMLAALDSPERPLRARALASALASVTRDIALARVDRGQP